MSTKPAVVPVHKAGDLPNVIGLVYIAAFAPDAGESRGQISEQLPPAAFEKIAPDSDGYLWIKQETWYQVSTPDRMINPDNERRIAQRMNPRKIIELDAGHASLASQPGPVVDLIDEAARELSGA